MIEYMLPEGMYRISREEQDRQECLFSQYQIKLKSGTITPEEYKKLFFIVHNCIVSQLKRRIGNLTKNSCIRSKYTSEEVEEMAIDGTLSLIKNMKKKRYVRYIIKTADYIACYALYNERKKMEDKVFKRCVDFGKIENYVTEVEYLDLNENGEVRRRRISKELIK